MSPKKMRPNRENHEQIISEARRERELREQGYREQALKLYPWLCARCGREFSGKKLRELTVHHKDHNHDNNPIDGSNWELLCLYCHDNEHQKYLNQELIKQSAIGIEKKVSGTFRPFADLQNLLKNKL